VNDLLSKGARAIELEAEMRKMTDVHIDLPVIHHFSYGVYMRELFIPAGTLIVGKVHKHEHVFMLLTGEISLVNEDGSVSRITAPFVCVSPPGTKRIAYHHADTVGMNIHANPSNTRDVDVIESETVCESLEDYDKFIELAKQQQLEGGQ